MKGSTWNDVEIPEGGATGMLKAWNCDTPSYYKSPRQTNSAASFTIIAAARMVMTPSGKLLFRGPVNRGKKEDKKLWAIDPQKRTRKSPAKNNPKPMPPPHKKKRPWPASRPLVRKNNRLNRLSEFPFGEADFPNAMALKLQQGQIWKHGNEFIRIVQLSRLEVAYKIVSNLKTGAGEHRFTSKKDFCRLLKECTPLPPKPPSR